MYPLELVKPMENELLQSGFTPLTDEQEVNDVPNQKGRHSSWSIVYVDALPPMPTQVYGWLFPNQTRLPDKLYTVFAGWMGKRPPKRVNF